MTESPLMDSGFSIPVFSLGDDLIASLNKAMAFLTAVASLSCKSNATSSRGNNASGKPKDKNMLPWYKDKAILVEAQEASQILDEEQLAFLADLGVPDGQAVQKIIPNNAAFQTEDLDTYDSECDDISNAKVVLIAKNSNYGSNVISEVPHSETYLNDMENQSVHAMQDFEQSPVVDFSDNKIHNDSNIIPYSQYLQETQLTTIQDTTLQAQQDSMILFVIEQMSKQMINHKCSSYRNFLRFDNVVEDKDYNADVVQMVNVGEYVNMERKRNEYCDKCFNLEAELLKSQKAHNDLLKKFFENNDLKAQLQEKDTAICKLKEIIKSMREKSKEENVNYDYCELETKNVELENSVAKLLLENERLCNEINLVEQYAENEDLKAQIQDKLDLEPLAPRLLQNREAHIDYLKYTQEQADILRGIELLVYVRDTCPNAIKLSAKKVAVTPKNNVKKVRFAEPLTSSSNIKQDDRISQTPSRNMKNKVEAQPRKVNKKNRVVEPIRDVDVKHSLLNANSELICATCTVRFGNDQIAMIIGYGDYQLRNVTISRVYYFEGLGHNLLSVGSRDTNLYIISLDDMLKTSPICLLSKASKTKSWLWHRRLSHLNFACALGKTKKSSHQPKAEDTNQEKLYLLHMDLCGPIRVASINRKRYILVIVDDYSRFTWVRFLRTKYEAPKAIIKCIKNIYVCLNAIVRNVRTDNGTEFVNQALHEFYENVSISHQTSVARTPQQNGVVERQNRTLVEAAFQEVVASRAMVLANSLVSTSIDQDAPSTSIPSTQEQEHSPNISQGFEESPKTPIFHDDPLHESLHKDSTSQGSSSNVR
ncbi:retrovirus-related pol polyprotein from transposon TNT 1-94 [Tanacetum coccineum]